MAKKTTTTKTSTESTTPSVVAPPVSDVPLAAAAPAVAPKEKKARATKAPKVDAAASVPAAVSEDVSTSAAAPAVEGDVVETDDQLNEQSIEFIAKLQQIGTLISSLKSEFRVLEKKWNRELKVAQKQSSKRKRKSGNRAPSGFVKPTRISDELSTFLAKPVGSEMARTEVTREINKYIRTHNLQDKDNGRKINPDAKLASLLKLKKTDELTYFNLQKYMSPHFAKASKETATTA
jgi:upstream activation factor subunit UAF30